MTVVRAWLRIDLRRRWRSLAVLTLLIVLAGGTVMASLAGARRAASALQRLSEPTLPATTAVLANTRGFNWAPIEALPEVAAVARSSSTTLRGAEGCPSDAIGFPLANSQTLTQLEKPVVYSGRMLNVDDPNEAVVTRLFVAKTHKAWGPT